MRGPAIYQTEAESAGSPKGKKHGLLFRLTPLLFYPQPTVALLSQSEDMLFRAVFVQREQLGGGFRGHTKGQRGVRKENEKDWMWLTVFSDSPV